MSDRPTCTNCSELMTDIGFQWQCRKCHGWVRKSSAALAQAVALSIKPPAAKPPAPKRKFQRLPPKYQSGRVGINWNSAIGKWHVRQYDGVGNRPRTVGYWKELADANEALDFAGGYRPKDKDKDND